MIWLLFWSCWPAVVELEQQGQEAEIWWVKIATADAVRLILGLVCADIYCCGLLSTRKSDCTGLPASMLRNPEGPQQRGQSHVKMKGNMSLISWYNKGNFRFLSNAYSPMKQGIDSGTQARRSCRELIAFMLVMGCLGVQIPEFAKESRILYPWSSWDGFCLTKCETVK